MSLIGILAIVIVVLLFLLSITIAIIFELVKEIRRWRLKVAYLESDAKRNNEEMLQ